jgi:spermidine/putrescine transport system permease protein
VAGCLGGDQGWKEVAKLIYWMMTEVAEEEVTTTTTRKLAILGGRNWIPWVQLAPAASFFALFFIAPLVILIVYSFYTYTDYDFTSTFTLQNYSEAITSSVFRTYLIRTLEVAGMVASVVTLVSFPLCYIMIFVFRRQTQILYFLVLVSLFGGYLVRIYAWRTLLGGNGLINDTLVALGVITHPSRIFLNNQFAVVVTMVNFYLPLGVLPIFVAMQNVSPGVLDAGRDLGSSTLHVVRRVMLPLTSRGVLAAFSFVFIATAAEWVTPLLVGGTNNQLLGNQIEYQFDNAINWPLGAALAICLIIVLLLFVGLVLLLLRWLSR